MNTMIRNATAADAHPIGELAREFQGYLQALEQISYQCTG